MNKLELTKQVVGFVVGAGASKVINTVIKNNVDPENIVDKIEVIGASIALGSLVGEATKKHTDAKIEEIASWWRANIKKD